MEATEEKSKKPMIQAYVPINPDLIELGIKNLKHSFEKSGLRKELLLKSIPKASERKKLKARMAALKKRKRDNVNK